MLLSVPFLGTDAPPASAQAAATLPCKFEPGPTRAVAAVINGDTVRLDDGIEVRLLGALAPHATDAGEAVGTTWPPAAETQAALEQMVAGKSAALAFAGPRADRYGRVLAHLFLNSDSQQIWVQGHLVSMGLARAYALAGSDACIEQLLIREREARQAGLGLWSHAAYQVRPADRPTELARYRFTFQLVRGRVERARGNRSLSIIELGSGERPRAADGKSQWGAFRVVWRRNIARSVNLPRAESLEGRNILVRGWISAHHGPEIEVTAAGQVEIEQ